MAALQTSYCWRRSQQVTGCFFRMKCWVKSGGLFVNLGSEDARPRRRINLRFRCMGGRRRHCRSVGPLDPRTHSGPERHRCHTNCAERTGRRALHARSRFLRTSRIDLSGELLDRGNHRRPTDPAPSSIAAGRFANLISTSPPGSRFPANLAPEPTPAAPQRPSPAEMSSAPDLLR
jgi:hypothetical protein